MTIGEIRHAAQDRHIDIVLTESGGLACHERRHRHPDVLRRIRTNRDAMIQFVTLERRLATGELKIERAEMAGDDQEVERLEGFWIDLLHTYETLGDQEAT